MDQISGRSVEQTKNEERIQMLERKMEDVCKIVEEMRANLSILMERMFRKCDEQ